MWSLGWSNMPENFLNDGWEQQVVLGHDVFVKARLHGFSGSGYEHIAARALPMLQVEYGISPAMLDQLMMHNPRRHLTYNPPARPNVRAGERTAAALPAEKGAEGDHP
jgi:hypothetical protein